MSMEEQQAIKKALFPERKHLASLFENPITGLERSSAMRVAMHGMVCQARCCFMLFLHCGLLLSMENMSLNIVGRGLTITSLGFEATSLGFVPTRMGPFTTTRMGTLIPA